jgi:micrococcal nuclease
MLVAFLLVACTSDPIDSGRPPNGDSGGETDTEDTAAEALAADDARVRALTGLPEGASPCHEPQLVRVLEAVDGDTFHALPEGDSWYFSVRIIGLDTPEIAHEDPEECYGDEAFAYTAGALDGKLVWLTFDAECQDDYERTLAYVFRGDDEEGFFNRQLLKNGYATPLTIRPNDTYEDLFAADARAAQQDGAGLWSACDR